VRKVNLFVIGAPKSGTTAICDYLSGHPKLCFSEPKEPKYFHTDFSNRHRYALNESDYQKCFKNLSEEHTVIAEGTVWYLYSAVAVKNILAYNPCAKFVVMLRDPVDLAYSLHSQLYYGGDEDEKDFAKAWRLQEQRGQGKNIPFKCRDAKSLQYGEIAKLGSQIRELLSVVDAKRVKFIVYDEFCNDPQSIYRELLEFVDLEYDDRVEFPRINENRSRRSGPLPLLMDMGKLAKNRLGIRRSLGLWRLLHPVLSHKEERPLLPERFRVELQEYFADDLNLLSTLVGKDLSAWNQCKVIEE